MHPFRRHLVLNNQHRSIFVIKKTLIALECQVGRQLGLERATLETDSGTLGAIRFYTRTGWTEVTKLRYASWKLSIMSPFCKFLRLTRSIGMPGIPFAGFMELNS